MKKLSELMLEGYAMVGKQTKGDYCKGDPKNPSAVCAVGACYLAVNGEAVPPAMPHKVDSLFRDFHRVLGVSAIDLNDEGMSIPDIAGIAAAEGL